jgi:hypothetical protein
MDGHDTQWTPREHDHVVEPIFAGLRGHEDGRSPEAGTDPGESLGRKWLWLAAAGVTASILVRAWMLL